MNLSPSLQIKRQLLRGILSGKFLATGKLPTILELAKTFNVSTKTIQKAVDALAEEGVIQPKRRVGLIVNPLHAQPRRGNRVGFVHVGFPAYFRNRPYPADVVGTLAHELHKEGLTLVPCPLGELDHFRLLESILKFRLNGMVVFELDTDTLITELKELRLPMVSVDYDAYRHGVSSVTFDQIHGMFLATQALIQQGHTHIALVRPLIRSKASGQSRILEWTDEERVKGYSLAMGEAGLVADVREFTDLERFPDVNGKVLSDMLGHHPMPTAFVCLSDWSAKLVAQEVLRLGYRIPEQVGVAGFGGNGYEFAPGRFVATVGVDCEGMGRHAAFHMARALKEKDHRTERVVLPTRWSPNDSVARQTLRDTGYALSAKTSGVG